MTDKELREIRLRAAAATPGDWYWSIRWEGGRMSRLTGGRPIWSFWRRTVVDQDGSANDRDAHFIAKAREDIPRLLAYVDELKKELAAERAHVNALVEAASE